MKKVEEKYNAGIPKLSIGKPLETIKPKKETAKQRINYDNHIGIYIIINDFLLTAYIGQSKNVPVRLRNHKANLKNGAYKKNGQADFQKDVDKHGIETFKFSQICVCEEPELYYWETYYCKEYFEKGYKLYNHYMNTDITGLQCPEPFKEVIQKAIKLLDKGILSKQQLEQALNQLEGNY